MIFIITIIALTLGFTIGSRRNEKILNQMKTQDGLIKLGLMLHKASKKDIERAERGIIKC